MPDYGLIGGLGAGLQAGLQAYMQERNYQDKQKADAFNKAIMLKANHLQLNATGQPEDDAQGLLKNKLELASTQRGLDRLDPNSQATAGQQNFASGILGQSGVKDPQGLLKGMSAADIGENEKYLGPVISGEYGLKKERILANKAKAEKVPTDSQFNAAMFGKRSEAADKIIQEVGNYRSTPGGKLDSLAPGFLMSDTAKKIDQAERNFVNAILRRESGAAISESEFKNAEAQYFPRSGDPQEVIDQKAQNRAQGILGLQAASGDAWSRVPMAAGPLERNVPKAGMQNAKVIQQGLKPVHKMTRAELLKELGG